MWYLRRPITIPAIELLLKLLPPLFVPLPPSWSLFELSPWEAASEGCGDGVLLRDCVGVEDVCEPEGVGVGRE